MIDQIFLFKVILSVIVGGVWITSSTVIADRFGTKRGGLIAGTVGDLCVALLTEYLTHRFLMTRLK